MGSVVVVASSDDLDLIEVVEAPGNVDVVSTSPQGTVVVGEVTQGRQGETGAQGLPGGFYEHTQTTPSYVWTVTHSLGYKPAGLEVDTADGDQPTIVHVTDNVLLLTFLTQTSGKSRHS